MHLKRLPCLVVALRSILDTDFTFGADDRPLENLDHLYQLSLSTSVRRPPEETVFTVVVRPGVPEEGLTLQVALPNVCNWPWTSELFPTV